jgi:uncharacterized protein YdhG (YjbR/CyaY superfamily)
MNNNATDVESYLAAVPDGARATFEQTRRIVKEMAPDATETISYGMPTFKHKGKWILYFGVWKDHCGLYGTSQGTVKFKPGELPEALVRAQIAERLAAIEASEAARKTKKPTAKKSA